MPEPYLRAANSAKEEARALQALLLKAVRAVRLSHQASGAFSARLVGRGTAARDAE